ncbi:hypothetical protein FH972_019837 [Carpinus fangiana]|uniref:Single-stranded DNA-binding protein n=1 Tax=Carpinus fangiana TaxID=176857 RepID=A0A5N6RTL5_9ROSI|nr:hypothetical protein FH972_019837 [Carpinus fangiana]
MANSVATLSRRLCRSLLPNAKPASHYLSSMSFSTDNLSDLDESEKAALNSDPDSDPPLSQQSSPSQPPKERIVYDYPLENGLDVGIYKAILVGQVGQKPLQKKLRSGMTLTMLSIGTGGIRNNRRPLDHEDPREYANRCAVQWHRVSIYPDRVGRVVMQNVVPGSILYLEGNLETKIFTDPVTGLVRRVREVAIRRNGRVVFLGKGDDAQQPSESEFKGVGYY